MTYAAKIGQIVRSKVFAVVTASVVAGATSAVVTYRVVDVRLTKKYEEISERELREAKQFYIQKYKNDESTDLDKLAARYDVAPVANDALVDDDEVTSENVIRKAATIMQEQGYVSYDKPPNKTEEVVEISKSKRNVFRDQPPSEVDVEFDQVTENRKRDSGQPYIITEDQYMTNEDEHVETQYTYYEPDGVVADVSDALEPDWANILGGEENLRFGYGSGDKHLVYICNPNKDGIYEVVRSTISFSQATFGQTWNEEEKEPVRKMRATDGY